VGVEVAIGSNLGELLKKESFGGFTSSEIAPFIAMYWGSLMIGRWTGAVSALNLSEMAKKWLRTFMPLIAFGVVMFFTWMAGYNIVPLKWYFLCVIVQMLAFFISNDKPAFTLLVFGILGTVATIVGLLNTGSVGIYAFLSAGLFLSIMWPCIFSLSVAGLGKYQSQGAGFLVMMILGGAILPPIQGKLADIIGIHESFVIATIAFLYLTYFAFFVKNSLKKQGIEFDNKIEGGH
jgi:FHS family L-fucose permease-like MFS transporter